MFFKLSLIVGGMIGVSSFFIPSAFAQVVPTQFQKKELLSIALPFPSIPVATQSGSTGLDNASNTNQVANTIKNFFKDLDAFSGGFILKISV